MSLSQKDVFISYASEDRPVAQRLAAGLEKAGISVWWDRQIQVGSEWDKTIEDALASAKCVVVVWTGQAKSSRWVRAEAREALKQEKVVPVMLEANAIPLAFTGIQALRFIGWNGEPGSKESETLLSVIRAKLEGKPIELPAEVATEASWVGKVAAVVGMKSAVGGVLALLLIGSSFVRVDPVISVTVETTRLEFQVQSVSGDKRLTDSLTFDSLTIEKVGRLSLSPPDRLLVADPADYDLTSDSYPPKAWVEIPVNGRMVQFEARSPALTPEVTVENLEQQEGSIGQLDGIVLTDHAMVTMEVSSDNALTWSVRRPQGEQRVVLSNLQAFQFIQSGLAASHDFSIPFPQDQELTYQAIFRGKPGILELFGRSEEIILVLKGQDPAGDQLISGSVLPVRSVDFSWQDPGTGERKSPKGFGGTVKYHSPQGLPPVTIEANAFLTLDDLEHFEITSIMVNPHRHVLTVALKGKAGYVKTGTAGNPKDLRPTVFDLIRFSPLFEPVSKLVGL